MKRRALLVVASVGIGVGQLSAVSCDPEKAALELFRRQALNLVKPVRDYITVGGIVVRKGNGPMEYIDPPDPVAGAAGGGDAFKGILMAEARQNTTKFGLALGMIKSVLPGSLDVSWDSSQEVKLDQVNAVGRRLTDGDVKTTIQRPKTKAEIVDDLNQGLTVYVIQEVYSADSMQISASSQTAFNAKYANGSAVQDCSPSKESTAKTDQPAKAGDAKAAEDGKTPSADKVTPGAKPTTKAATPPETTTATPKPAEKKAPADATAKPADSADAGGDKLSIGVGVCRAGTYSLKFKTDQPGQFLPFAVRLKEVERRDGQLALKRGTVAPNATLGPNAQRFALVDDSQPLISGIRRRAKK